MIMIMMIMITIIIIEMNSNDNNYYSVNGYVQDRSTAGLDTRIYPIQRVVLKDTFGGCILIYSNCTSLWWVCDHGGGLVRYKSCFGSFYFSTTAVVCLLVCHLNSTAVVLFHAWLCLGRTAHHLENTLKHISSCYRLHVCLLSNESVFVAYLLTTTYSSLCPQTRAVFVCSPSSERTPTILFVVAYAHWVMDFDQLTRESRSQIKNFPENTGLSSTLSWLCKKMSLWAHQIPKVCQEY